MCLWNHCPFAVKWPIGKENLPKTRVEGFNAAREEISRWRRYGLLMGNFNCENTVKMFYIITFLPKYQLINFEKMKNNLLTAEVQSVNYFRTNHFARYCSIAEENSLFPLAAILLKSLYSSLQNSEQQERWK